MKRILVSVLLGLSFLIIFTNLGFASTNGSVIYGSRNYKQENAVVYGARSGDVNIQTIVCGDYTNWYDIGKTYCKIDITGVLCLKCYNPGEVRYQDQEKFRECWILENPSDKWREYEYRTIPIGCCSICW